MVGVCGAGSTKGSFHLRSIRLKTELIDFFFLGGGGGRGWVGGQHVVRAE